MCWGVEAPELLHVTLEKGVGTRVFEGTRSSTFSNKDQTKALGVWTTKEGG